MQEGIFYSSINVVYICGGVDERTDSTRALPDSLIAFTICKISGGAVGSDGGISSR